MRIVLRLFIAVVHFPREISKLLQLVVDIAQSMTNNRFFPNPIPALADLLASRDDLERAQTLADSRARGTRATRDQKKRDLKSLLKQLVAYVQRVADTNPDQAEAIIRSAHLEVKRVNPFHRPEIEVVAGRVSGEVILRVKSAGPRASYEWQYGTDGKTWTNLPPTLQAKTTVKDLPQGTILFRFRAVTKAGAGDWSQPVSYPAR